MFVTKNFGELNLPMEEPLFLPLSPVPADRRADFQEHRCFGNGGHSKLDDRWVGKHRFSKVNACPEVRHAFVEAEHLLGDVQLVFLRVDLISGAALGLLDQQVVSDGGGNPSVKGNSI